MDFDGIWRFLLIVSGFCQNLKFFRETYSFFYKSMELGGGAASSGDFSRRNDPFFFESMELGGGAASGGDFSRKNIPFSQK